jgi:hypothetical protein
MTVSINFKRDVLPHLIAILIFLLLVAVYFYPVLFEGKGLAQHDILQFKGGAQEIVKHREQTGEEALWTNSMFSGMPSYLINTRYPGDFSGIIHSILTFKMPALAGNIFITLLCAYILLITLGIRSWLAIVGAIAFAFTSYNIIILEAGHNTKSLTIAYIPLVLAGLIHALRKNVWIGAALFAVGLTLNLHFNHLQMTYYLLLLVIVFGITEIIYAIKHGTIADLLKRGAILAVAAVLAVGVNFGRLLTTAEYTEYSIRGKSELNQTNNNDQVGSGLDKDYAFSWSYGVGETMTLLIPDFFGGSSSAALDTDSETYQAFLKMGAPEQQARQLVNSLPMYWGAQPMTSGPVYVGAIICFLFVLGLFIVNRRWTSWLVAGTILSLILAWGKNFEVFNYFMFDYFPGYNKFRAVSSALVIAQITIPFLAMLALAKLFRAKDIIKDLDKKVLYAGSITGGICLLVWLFSGMAGFSSPIDQNLMQAQFPVDAIRADRESMMRSDALRSLIFIVLAVGILYFYLKDKLSATIAIVGIGILVLTDLWTVDKRYLNNNDFQKQVVEAHFQPTLADQTILQDQDLSFRVYYLPNPFNDARSSYYHKSIGGYHGAKLRRYQDVIDRHISQNNLEVLRMLNTRYAITGDQKQPVQRIPDPLGNAWFVEEIKPVVSPDEELDALTLFDAGTTAVVDIEKFPIDDHVYAPDNGSINLVTYEPDYLKYDYQAKEEGVIVFSEIYYPAGWQAYLDGKPVSHFRANYVLRAMKVPEGKHTIEFRFDPQSYKVGNMVSLISSILLVFVIAGAVMFAVKKKTREEEVNEI